MCRQRYWGEPIPIYFPVDMEDASGDPRKGDKHTIRYVRQPAIQEADSHELISQSHAR